MEKLDQILMTASKTTAVPKYIQPSSRRLDWRFLLPNPLLSSVALINPLHNDLTDAIIPLCDEYSMVDNLENNSLPKFYDLLVLQMPSFSILRQVKDFIQPDVSLYLEGVNYLARIISRGKSEAQIPNSGQEYHSAAGYIDILKSAGFSKMHIYWIWPDLKNTNKFIPINDFAPLAYVLNRNKRGKLARAKGLITRLAVQSGLIMHLVPYYCIVAKRGTP